MRGRKYGSRSPGQGRSGGSFQAGVNAALAAVRQQLAGGRSSLGRKSAPPGRARRSSSLDRFSGEDFEEADYRDDGRRPVRIGHRM